MLTNLKQFSDKLTGKSKGVQIEHQIFNLTCFVIFIFGVQAGIINYLIGLHYMTVVLAVPGCLIALIIYLISIKSDKLNNKLLITFVIATYLVLMPLHFYNGGSYGTVFFLMIMLINMFILIGKVKQIFYLCLSLTLAILSLIFIEMYFPDLVIPYKDSSQRFSDFITVLIYSITFTSYIFWMYKKNHEKSRRYILAQNIKLEESHELIEKKNEKIEALLIEMHHRIKNNLQVVSSLISLQINRVESINPKKALIESRNRLDIMSLLHQQLHINEIGTSVVLSDFISSICNSLKTVFEFKEDTINIHFEQKSASIDFDIANCMGLILNELITNSIKYALPENGILNLEICFSSEIRDESEFLVLVYTDNGANRIHLNEIREDSLGLKIIHTLVKQLNSELKIDTSSKNIFTLKTPL